MYCSKASVILYLRRLTERKNSSVSGTCSVEKLGDSAACVRTPERPFALWSMQNLALFLQEWYKELNNAIDSASLFTAQFANTFISYSSQEPAGEAAWLTIVAGMFGSIGAFSGGAGTYSGLITIAAGAASLSSSSPPEDPRFTNFATAQAKLGEAKLEVMDTMDKYFKRLLADTPPNDEWETGTELARIIESGAFADQDIAQAPSNSTMTRWVQASMISGMWNTGNVAIIKWSNDNPFARDYGFSPCFGRPGIGNSQAVACVMDHNFLIARMAVQGNSRSDASHVRDFPDIGQSEETLQRYGLSQLQVIRSAMRTQEAANSYLPTSNVVKKLVDDVTNSPGENIADFLPLFNIPVCDLDKLPDLVPQYSFCRMLHLDDDYSNRCIQKIMSDNCKRLPLGGSQWPYVYDDW
ncbi:hypothetical protein SODALDRAFT_105095 [Sodiomyces alkalinus F11]|uniref:Uncharacterized protein n=1 Tax=Sodiomyces alkalinus (strain CBS 110278 / VKM F-3762 / F11) TaxID=1314773 RepID=A0A3N2Q230_SODAK|nr:hypothetical protein SODALDRAFT_105095 [Sodiomyces alkalinus F11]ROT40792.1 hypothetical protein SODALDRAFT_105095 [Sodiomyces alkalinus F11]